jgi:hypothetical protein
MIYIPYYLLNEHDQRKIFRINLVLFSLFDPIMHICFCEITINNQMQNGLSAVSLTCLILRIISLLEILSIILGIGVYFSSRLRNMIFRRRRNIFFIGLLKCISFPIPIIILLIY